jgi:mannose-6-phosphate isomerase-like protein (cupin superfamily)
MSTIGRYARLKARVGQGDALASLLLDVARGLEEDPACLLYVVNRVPGDPDTIWVTEAWRSREELEAALKADDARERIGEAQAMIEDVETIDTAPVGGAGLPDAGEGVPPYTHVALSEVPDMAEAGGFSEMGTARFANKALATRTTGISLQTLHPGRRQAFGHRHHRAEEVYVILRGSGRAKLGDEVIDVAAGDALRVAPRTPRAFEAGDDGIELLAVGPRTPGDPEMLPGWWEG